jgi:hypothetical protein
MLSVASGHSEDVMMRWTKVAVATMLLVPAAAGAQTAPPVTCLGAGDVAPPSRALFARIMVGASILDFTPCLRSAGKVHTLSATFLVGGVASGRVDATYDEDPFINFGIVTTNIGAGPTDYMFTFGTPIVGGLYTNAISSLAGTLTAGTGTGTLTNASGPIPFLRGVGTVGGVRVPLPAPGAGNLGVDVGVATCATTSTVNCPASPAAGANTFAPRFYDDLEATVTYRQGGVLSQASFTGRVEIFTSTVPEPATVSLLATGVVVLGLGGLARRRRG